MTDQTIDAKKHFATARRQLIDRPLKDFGFKPYKTSVLGRLTEDNVFQFIDFHKYRFGGQFTVEIAIRPLYCPHDDHLTLLPGNRLYSMATNGKSDKWWMYSNEQEANESFAEVHKLIADFAFPFFDATLTSKQIIKSYERNFLGASKFGKRISWGTIGWEDFDFGHIYLRGGDNKNALKHFHKCFKEFNNDSRDWAQTAAKKCLDIKAIINSGQQNIEQYLIDTIKDSKQKLKLSQW